MRPTGVVLVVLILILVVANIVVAIANIQEVTLGGMLACRFRVSAGGLSPLERRVIADKRIVEALNYHIELGDVVVAKGKWGAEVRLQKKNMGVNMLLATATPKDAKANQETTDKLGNTWAFGDQKDIAGFLGLLWNASPKEPVRSRIQQK